MQSQNRFFDDIARVAGGAAGALSGLRGEIEARIRDQLERILSGMDLVSREEFEAVKAMAVKARTEQEELQRRVAELEARLVAAGDKTPVQSPRRIGAAGRRKSPGSSDK